MEILNIIRLIIVGIVIGEVERVVARDGRVAGIVVKGRDAVVDTDIVVLALGPWSDSGSDGRLKVSSGGASAPSMAKLQHRMWPRR